MPSGNDPRIYSIAADTASGSLNAEMLAAEIDADAGITTARRTHANGGWLRRTGDSLSLWGASAWSAGAEITALDAVVAAHAGVATSSAFQFWEINTKQTSTSETWAEQMSRVAAALSAGTYVASWYFELKLNPTGPINSIAAARFRVDATTKGSAETQSGSTTAADGWIAFAGWDRIVAAEGDTPDLSLDIRRDPTAGGNDTVEIRKMKLGVQLMG